MIAWYSRDRSSLSSPINCSRVTSVVPLDAVALSAMVSSRMRDETPFGSKSCRSASSQIVTPERLVEFRGLRQVSRNGGNGQDRASRSQVSRPDRPENASANAAPTRFAGSVAAQRRFGGSVCVGANCPARLCESLVPSTRSTLDRTLDAISGAGHGLRRDAGQGWPCGRVDAGGPRAVPRLGPAADPGDRARARRAAGDLPADRPLRARGRRERRVALPARRPRGEGAGRAASPGAGRGDPEARGSVRYRSGERSSPRSSRTRSPSWRRSASWAWSGRSSSTRGR